MDDASPVEFPELTAEKATEFVRLSIHCVDREYPYKIGYRFASQDWVKPHFEVHPSFYGCWDWHSAVHGHWAMIKVLKEFPEVDVRDSILQLLEKNFSNERLAGELAFFENEEVGKTFERTYGWAWFLKLYAEVMTWELPQARQWEIRLQPIAEILSQRTIDYLQVLSNPLRPGTHVNTAFSFGLMLEYVDIANDQVLREAIERFSHQHFLLDQNCPVAYEPSGTDFISPCLAEAACMSKILPQDSLGLWLDQFLPEVSSGQFTAIRIPPEVLDKEDPGIGHLIGLMFQRAWCYKTDR